jgi:hypothetical protein
MGTRVKGLKLGDDFRSNKGRTLLEEGSSSFRETAFTHVVLSTTRINRLKRGRGLRGTGLDLLRS